MTHARLRREVRKRREAREVGERKARRIWAASLPPPSLELREGPGEHCNHMWGEPKIVVLSCESQDVIRVCGKCHGFLRTGG